MRAVAIPGRRLGLGCRLGHNGVVPSNRWFNQSLPQTLQIATMLLYFNAVLLLLSGAFVGPSLLLIAGFVAGGFGIANEKKWGYIVAIAAAAVQVLIVLVFAGLGQIFSNIGLLLDFMFDVALFLLLVHPMSREYQRIWFK
jgi:hypothetical protein